MLQFFQDKAISPRRQGLTTTFSQGIQGHATNTFRRKIVKEICAELPTFEAFAATIGVPSFYMQGWRKSYPTFEEAWKACQDIQKSLLLDRGLTGQYESAAFLFCARNMTDMVDVQPVPGVNNFTSVQLVVVPAGLQGTQGTQDVIDVHGSTRSQGNQGSEVYQGRQGTTHNAEGALPNSVEESPSQDGDDDAPF